MDKIAAMDQVSTTRANWFNVSLTLSNLPQNVLTDCTVFYFVPYKIADKLGSKCENCFGGFGGFGKGNKSIFPHWQRDEMYRPRQRPCF